MEKLYIAYGSNMNKRRMKKRCPRARAIGKGQLDGYSLEFRGSHGNGVATIIKKRNSSVPVVLWSITEECERALDAYEGFPRLYGKETLEVTTGEKNVTAMVYIMNPIYNSKKMAALPSYYYYSIIKEGYKDFGIDDEPLREALDRTYEACKLPQSLIDEILEVRNDGRTNMFDIPMVMNIASELGCYELVDFLLEKDNHRRYSSFIMSGK